MPIEAKVALTALVLIVAGMMYLGSLGYFEADSAKKSEIKGGLDYQIVNASAGLALLAMFAAGISAIWRLA